MLSGGGTATAVHLAAGRDACQDHGLGVVLVYAHQPPQRGRGEGGGAGHPVGTNEERAMCARCALRGDQLEIRAGGRHKKACEERGGSQLDGRRGRATAVRARPGRTYRRG